MIPARILLDSMDNGDWVAVRVGISVGVSVGAKVGVRFGREFVVLVIGTGWWSDVADGAGVTVPDSEIT